MNLNKLTKKELIHLIDSLRSAEDIERGIKRNLKHQEKNNIHCFECQEIARKLKVSI